MVESKYGVFDNGSQLEQPNAVQVKQLFKHLEQLKPF